MLAHGFAQLTFEGRIGCGERLGQIAQIVRLDRTGGGCWARLWLQLGTNPFACR